MNTDLNWMGASQLAPAGGRTAFNLKAKLAELKPITNTFGGDAVDRTVTNPYGNATNPGDLTYNRDGSTTVMYLAIGAEADTSANALEVPTYHACILSSLLDANTALPN